MRAPLLCEFDYVLKADRDLPAEERTTFRLRPLTFREREDISTTEAIDAGEGTKIAINRFTITRKILNYGLVGWKNLLSFQGTPLEFARTNGVLSDTTLDSIQDCATEIANAITERSQVDKELAKN